jgi:transposase
MDGSKGQPIMTAGLDLGDRYSYPCLIDTGSGEVVVEGRLRTTPEALKRRFASEQAMRIAIEAGTHSPWVSRVLEECGHVWPRGLGGQCPQTETHLRQQTQNG